MVERSGCDRDPIDPTSEDGRLTLLSYLWPGQDERFETLRGALDVAARASRPRSSGPTSSTGSASSSPTPRPGVATVVFHSIVWQYLSDAARARGARPDPRRGGARDRSDAPLAWLRLEPRPPSLGVPDVRLNLWPGGEERTLATASFHTGPVHWQA